MHPHTLATAQVSGSDLRALLIARRILTPADQAKEIVPRDSWWLASQPYLPLDDFGREFARAEIASGRTGGEFRPSAPPTRWIRRNPTRALNEGWLD